MFCVISHTAPHDNDHMTFIPKFKEWKWRLMQANKQEINEMYEYSNREKQRFGAIIGIHVWGIAA